MSHFSKVTAVFSAFVLLGTLCGCRSDIYYQNRAVERARAFLLKEAKDMELHQQEFIRYADPVILHSHILGKTSHGLQEQLETELRQICVTWQLPGQQGVYMVYGVSNGRMAEWQPERVIRKTFVNDASPLAAAAAQAVNYTVNNLAGDLNKVELNKIRFTAPALHMTNFEVSVKRPEDPEERAAFDAKHAQKVQYSLVWELDADKYVYFCGFAMPNMGQWELERAGIIRKSEFEPRSLRTVLSSEQFYNALPELEQSAAKK